jgi:hypothetical protein
MNIWMWRIGIGYGQDPYTDFYGSVGPDPYDLGLIRIYTDSVFIRIFFLTYPYPYRDQILIRSPDPYKFPYGLRINFFHWFHIKYCDKRRQFYMVWHFVKSFIFIILCPTQIEIFGTICFWVLTKEIIHW